MKRGAISILLGVFVALGAAQGASASNLTYWGGPVAHSMNVVLVYWGAGVRSTYSNATTGDPAFFRYLASQSGSTSDIGGVLAQYMDTSGGNSANSFGYQGAFQITPSSGSATVDDSTIQSELQSNIASATLPAPAGDGLSTVYVVLFPPGDNVCLQGTCSTGAFCAYHGSFPLNGSTHVLYAAMVDNGPGSPNYGGCGSNATDLNNQTSVTSHEVGETINDPLVAEAPTLGPPLAWYWYDSSANQGEIADKCDGLGEQALNGPWTVEKLWSNLDGVCEASEPSFLAPTAAFTAPSTASAGEALPFDGGSSSDPDADHTSVTYGGHTYALGPGIVGYLWNWGDGSALGSGASTSHSYGADGTYQVSLTVVDNMGFISTVTHPVVVGAGSSPPTTPAPTVTTGSAGSVGSSSATLTGTVNPRGAATTYHFEFGTTTAYGHSSVAASSGGGTSAVAVAAGLGGLAPRTLYHYRLVASSAGGTTVGADRTFVTGAAPPPPPRFSFRLTSGHALGAALRHGLRLRFSCSSACTARFNVTLVLPGVTRLAATPVTVAQGQRRLGSAGSGRLTLLFSSAARTRLRRRGTVRLTIAGYAVRPGGATSEPKTVRLTLRR